MNLPKNSLPQKISILVITSAIILILALQLHLALAESGSSFNIEIEIPKSYHSVEPGDELLFTTKLVQLYNQNTIDITLVYSIADSNRKIIASRSKTVAIGTQASFAGSIRVPPDANEGRHILKVKVVPVVEGKINSAESETEFYVTKKNSSPSHISSVKPKTKDYIILGAIIITAILAILISKNKRFLQKIQLKLKIKKIVDKRVKDRIMKPSKNR